ncbi:cysteine-rich receptor-like protein kinase 2 [Corylus avellana]|uniref:cysteine-rich receptor-like protein kinase 2 n=1 Tax=Corylus avellana TaxID=13451 RepID=UPI00286CA88F|nr:cysteine-rich receptor-like protein kinase 2 [Corylus avellana]
MTIYDDIFQDPQINLLNKACSQYNVSSESSFYTNLNATFSNLRAQLTNNTNTRFATPRDSAQALPALVQCRNYLSSAECLACFTAAVSQIRNCSAANGARVIYDGCFLRYESSSFYDQTTQPGGEGAAVKELLVDLQLATPRINGFFAASKKEVVCGVVASTNSERCLPGAVARAVDAGCFLISYESSSFYDQTTEPGNEGICGNQTASQPTAFSAAVKELLADLQVATPRINGFFAASKKEAVGSAGNATVYAVAQCAETVSEIGCQDCLTVASRNAEVCIPSVVGRAIDAGCFLRYSETPFFADNQTTNILPFLGNGSSSNKKAIIGGVVGGVVGAVLILAVFVWFIILRRGKPIIRGDILGATELRGPVNYKYKDLKSATKNFSEENKLGEGGFGDVYKGTLKNGKIVAVKKLAISQSSRAKADFESEVKLISNVHHRNMIRLLGCCTKGPELLLVYEYMANSSLDKFLFGERRGSLNWKQRNDIIMGTAKGLAYLHEEFHVCIIHRDIKTGHILLDDDFQAKIADFGLARLLPEDKSHLSTRFAGTLGYTAPEYAIHGQLSEKVDIYSFGIVVLEILCGRRISEVKNDPNGEYLLERAWKLYENDKHQELVDETLDPNEYTTEEVRGIIEIALLCIQSSPALRPSMSEVVVLLKSKRSVERQPPSTPAYVDTDQKKVRGDTSTSTASSTSNATASISQVSGR